MYFKILSFVALVLVAFVHAQCPDGGEIFERGISSAGKEAIVNAHNEYRQMIMDGEVEGQPKGKNIAMMSFDEDLAREGEKVSETCKMSHVIAEDSRWSGVGQNLYMSWSSENDDGQDWEAAARSWFDEHKDFIYPSESRGGVTGHYTQLIWATSNKIGCDFISFFDNSVDMYAKLYTCNYGPGGNFMGEAPYELA